MTKLTHKLTNDLLFKMTGISKNPNWGFLEMPRRSAKSLQGNDLALLQRVRKPLKTEVFRGSLMFVKYQNLLQWFVAALLGINHANIKNFHLRNPKIPPESHGDKFCRLDINMEVNGQLVGLEIQVENDGHYPKRSLFYCAKGFSSAIKEGEDNSLLPRTITVSILGFKQFPCHAKFHWEFQMLEVTTGELLTDKFVLHFYELPKLPELTGAENMRDLWLKLFKAETEEDIAELEKLEVPIMREAIGAYRHVAASDEFKEKERLRSKARHDEAQALRNAERRRDEHWQGIVADKDARLADKDARLADKDVQLAEQAARIAELEAKLLRYL